MTKMSKPETCGECCQPIESDTVRHLPSPWTGEKPLDGVWHKACGNAVITRMHGHFYGEHQEPAPAGHCSRCRAEAPDGMCWVVQGEPRARFCLDCAVVVEARGVTLVHRPTVHQILTALEWERADIGAN